MSGWQHPFRPPDPDELPTRAELARESLEDEALQDETNHLDELDAIAPDRRQLLVCECGVVAIGLAEARCGRDRRTNISLECPARWEIWERVDGGGA